MADLGYGLAKGLKAIVLDDSRRLLRMIYILCTYEYFLLCFVYQSFLIDSGSVYTMAQTTARPSIVLVSGACHTEFHIRPVVPYFEKAGYRIIPRPLYSAGHPAATFEDDVAKIQSTISSELQSGQDVCVIVHSAGGCSGCEQ